ncbi:MAG: hypothetical protein LBO73_04090 [Holosporaceae bacterium]|jgi:hypothetical protein|nr:hypothetical protein [Holosporaceae bacterium]
MRRKRFDPLLKRAVVFSLSAHAAALLLWTTPISGLKRDDTLLVSVGIVGETEADMPFVPLQKVSQPKIEPEKIEPEEVKQEEEIPPEENMEEEIPSEEKMEEAIPPEEKMEEAIPPKDETEPEKNLPEETQRTEEIAPPSLPPEPPREVSENKTRDATEDKAENKIETDEGPFPKFEEKPPEKKLPPVPKKIRRQNREFISNLIKIADRRKAKNKKLKQMLEIAEKEEYKKKTNQDFDKMLSGSIAAFRKKPAKSENGGENFGVEGNAISEDFIAASINSRIKSHWIVPSGVKDAENVAVDIHVQFGDGWQVKEVRILDEKRYATDPVFRAAADSARRAILEMGALKISGGLPKNYGSFTFHFDPRKMLRGHGG